jgi:hypothetical protein
MLSSVYQLSTEMNQANFAKDGANRFYWRQEKRRMDAEQVRDSIMFVSGNLDKSNYGPSQELTPANMRRTVYGRVSRYKLDTYLQTFDFPSPAISAEKRFITTVPLQRLFLMNSDFSQIEAEELAKRVASEPNNRARIKKAYEIVMLRQPTEQEIQLGLDYLTTEPLKEYEELKAKEKEAAPAGRGRGGRGGAAVSKVETPKSDAAEAGGSGMPPAEEAVSASAEAKPAEAKDKAASDKTATADAKPMPMPPDADAAAGAAPAAAADADMGNGMMGGVNGRRGGRGGAAEIKYDPTAWGRYAKVLFSSSEFLFIN